MSTVCGVSKEIAINSNIIIKCTGFYNKIFRLKGVNHFLPDAMKMRAWKAAWFCEDCKKASFSSDKDSERLAKKILVSLLDEFYKEMLA